MLTRRDVSTLAGFEFTDVVTQSLDELIDKSDLVVECTGDVVDPTARLSRVMQAGKPIITMNSEFHVTTGSWFVNKGWISEAEGDQPGSLAALHEEALGMGFKPLVYGNSKGYLNPNPKPEDMQYWAEKQGISVKSTTAFTDGTKVQIEQAFVANGLGATILQQGLLGPRTETWQEAAFILSAKARELGQPVSDYVIATGRPPAVFMVAAHEESEIGPLQYFKMGPGPDYLLPRDYHLCFLEVPRLIHRALARGKPLLTNSAKPTVSVAAIAKRELKKGEHLPYAIGSFAVRGEAIRVESCRDHVPIGILENAVIKQSLEPGQIVTWDDVELPESLALNICREIFI